MDKIEWIKMLIEDGVSVDEAMDMAVDFFGITDSAEENRLFNEAEKFATSC